MKKMLMVMVVVLVFAVPCFAAEGIVWSCKSQPSTSNTKWRQITAVVTTASNGSLTATRLGGTAGTQGSCYDVRGLYLYQIKTYFGGTAVTADSDLVLNPGTADTADATKDILNGAGTNMIDDNTNKTFKPFINGVDAPVPIFDYVYLDITGNSVDTAIHTVTLEFIQ